LSKKLPTITFAEFVKAQGLPECPSPETLRQWYCDEFLDDVEIGAKCHMKSGSVGRLRRSYGIHSRGSAEASRLSILKRKFKAMQESP